MSLVRVFAGGLDTTVDVEATAAEAFVAVTVVDEDATVGAAALACVDLLLLFWLLVKDDDL